MALDYSASVWMMSDVGPWQHFNCLKEIRVFLILILSEERQASVAVQKDSIRVC